MIAMLSFCLIGCTEASEGKWCYDFKKDINFEDKGEDVEALKIGLLSEGFYKAEWQSDSFDVYVAAAVMGFQNKYKEDVLLPIGLKNPTGIVSTMTVRKLNDLFSCKNGGIDIISELPKEEVVVVEVTFDQEKEDAISKAVNYIKKYLVSGRDVVVSKADSIVKKFYRFEAEVEDMVVPTYVSTDGTVMVYQETDITKEPEYYSQTEASVEVVKSNKPKVELFVMSHCPYGTQIEKGMIPVIEALGDKIDFELKFCDYAMHGEIELREQLTQHCIKKEQSEKFLPYLKCFLKNGDSSECISLNLIDKEKLNKCISDTDDEFKVIESLNNNVDYNGQFPGFNIYKEDNEKYGIQGSPTLIVNGVQVQSNRDSASLLNVICSGFDNVPEECSAVLSSDNPAPGFGEGSVGEEVSGGCN